MQNICEMCKDPERKFYARGYCKNCYRKAMSSGLIETKFVTRPKGDYSKNICVECGIEGQQQTKGKCKSCYSREREAVRRSNPEAFKRKMDNLKKWQNDHPDRVKESKRESYKRHRDSIRNRVKKYRELNGDKIRERVKERYHSNKEHYKFKRIEQLYGLTKDSYLEMLSSQNNACAICKLMVELVVDHDHSTGKVRQLLCSDCNTSLGFLERKGLQNFDSMKQYLETHQVSEVLENG